MAGQRDTPTTVQLSSPAMSILLAIDCGSYIAIAADSMVTEAGGVRRTAEKLRPLPGRPFVWGFTGDEGIGLQFAKWFEAWEWPEGISWEALADRAIEELSRLNGRKRTLVRLAGEEPKDDDVASVLMAGYVGGVRDIYELDVRGSAQTLKSQTLVAVGSGHPHAFIAFRTLKHASRTLGLDTGLARYIAEIAASLAPMCGLPVRVLKIDEHGVHQPDLPTPAPAAVSQPESGAP